MILIIIFAIVTPLIMIGASNLVAIFFAVSLGPAAPVFYVLARPYILGVLVGVPLLSLLIFYFISRSWKRTGILLLSVLVLYIILSYAFFLGGGVFGFLLRELYKYK